LLEAELLALGEFLIFCLVESLAILLDLLLGGIWQERRGEGV
jgi:hypothetical protein